MAIYQEGMLCKHFKGTNLYEKNIYRIIKLHIDGKDIDESIITYTGDGVLENAKDLVVYANIFQNDRLFTREYSDISGELSDEKKQQYMQTRRVEPLTQEEISIVTSQSFIDEKLQLEVRKVRK